MELLGMKNLEVLEDSRIRSGYDRDTININSNSGCSVTELENKVTIQTLRENLQWYLVYLLTGVNKHT